MRRLLGAAGALALLAAPARSQRVEDFLGRTAIAPLLEAARGGGAAVSAGGARAAAAADGTKAVPLAPRYAVVARVPLGSPDDYWRSALTFEAEGVKIHLSGNKDVLQGEHDGYFFSLLEEGQAEPRWVVADTKPVPFEVRGKTYFIKIDLSIKTALFHVERLKIVITKQDDPSYRVELLAGQIARGLIETGRPFELFHQERRALYMQNVVEVRRRPGEPSGVAPRPGHHTLMIGQVFPYTFDGNKTCAKFDLLIFDGETIEGRYPDGSEKIWPKAMGKRRENGKDRLVTYGFHIDADASGRKTLVIYDMTAPVALVAPR